MKKIILAEIKKIIAERVKWTKELIQKEAEKYGNRGEFQKKSPNAYSSALRKGIMDDVTQHMVTKRNNNWTYDDIFRIAQNYDRLIYFRNNENGAFLFAK
jgi:hypothetical protein